MGLWEDRRGDNNASGSAAAAAAAAEASPTTIRRVYHEDSVMMRHRVDDPEFFVGHVSKVAYDSDDSDYESDYSDDIDVDFTGPPKSRRLRRGECRVRWLLPGTLVGAIQVVHEDLLESVDRSFLEGDVVSRRTSSSDAAGGSLETGQVECVHVTVDIEALEDASNVRCKPYCSADDHDPRSLAWLSRAPLYQHPRRQLTDHEGWSVQDNEHIFSELPPPRFAENEHEVGEPMWEFAVKPESMVRKGVDARDLLHRRPLRLQRGEYVAMEHTTQPSRRRRGGGGRGRGGRGRPQSADDEGASVEAEASASASPAAITEHWYWVGCVEEIWDNVTVEFSDGVRCEMMQLTPDDLSLSTWREIVAQNGKPRNMPIFFQEAMMPEDEERPDGYPYPLAYDQLDEGDTDPEDDAAFGRTIGRDDGWYTDDETGSEDSYSSASASEEEESSMSFDGGSIGSGSDSSESDSIRRSDRGDEEDDKFLENDGCCFSPGLVLNMHRMRKGAFRSLLADGMWSFPANYKGSRRRADRRDLARKYEKDDAVVHRVDVGEISVDWEHFCGAIGTTNTRSGSPKKPPAYVRGAEKLRRVHVLNQFDYSRWAVHDIAYVKQPSSPPAASASASGASSSGARRRAKSCRFFQRGHCKFGSRCRFSHDARPGGGDSGTSSGPLAPDRCPVADRADTDGSADNADVDLAEYVDQRTSITCARVAEGPDVRVRIVRTVSHVDVRWQDGRVESGVPSTSLQECRYIGEHDFLADEYAYLKDDFGAEPSDADRLEGGRTRERTVRVISVDHRERTARISRVAFDPSLRRHDCPTRPCLVLEDQVETVSVYQLTTHPEAAYKLPYGAVVWRVDVRAGKYEDLHAEGIIGHIIGSRGGQYVVSWLDFKQAPGDDGVRTKRMPSRVWPWEVTGFDPRTSDGDGDDDDDEEEWGDEEDIGGGFNEQVAAVLASSGIIFDADGHPISVSEVLPTPERATVANGDLGIDTLGLAGEDPPSAPAPPAPPPPPAPAPAPTASGSAASPSACAPARFDSLPSCADHHFLSRYRDDCAAYDMNSRSQNKTIAKEYALLQRELPESMYVRCFDDCSRLLRCCLVGAEDTPYARLVFVFDMYMPPRYPAEPPVCHYHSFGYRVNPNLYENGTICLSLLNTWHGGSSCEMWNPNKSNILQVLLSIQSLVLNEEPYYNEAGYTRQKGTAEGAQNARNYAEQSYLASVQTTIMLLRRPPFGTNEILRHHIVDSGAQLLEECRARASDAAGSEGEAAASTAAAGEQQQQQQQQQQQSTAGFRILLRQLVPKLEEGIGAFRSR